MGTAALDLNDAAIALVADGAVLVQEAGCAAAAGGALVFGAEALKQSRLRPLESSSRYWRELSDKALPHAVGACRTSADLVHAHLQRLQEALPPDCGSVIAAVPSYWSPQQLGLLLGIARDIGLPLAGLVNGAVAATRRPYPGRQLWHLDLSLFDVGLTAIGQDGAATLGQAQRHAWLSAQALDQACARAIARAFLRSSRFDPFHDAASEQELHGRLDEWMSALRGREPREIAMNFRGNEFRAVVQPDDMRDAVKNALEPLLQKLRALCGANSSAVLQVPDRLAAYPGALETLAQLPGWEVFALEPAAAAAGALRLRAQAAGGAIALTTSLPWDRPPADVAAAGGNAAPAETPTHIAYQGRVYRLAASPFHIGSELAGSEYGLRLPPAVQAVSRRHCTVLVEDGRVLVHDHSRYGTRLNGHRIEGSAVLNAGDTLQLGQPPVTLALVAEVRNDAAPA